MKTIRKQLPADEASKDLDYIFNLLNSDFETSTINIKNFRLGNEWMIGISNHGSVAIKYSNIQKFQWKRIDRDNNGTDKNGLSILCLDETYEFALRGNYEAFLSLREILPEKEYSKYNARKDLSDIYYHLKNRTHKRN